MLDFFKISSGTRASPPGLPDSGYGNPVDRPTVQVEIPPPPPSCVLFVRFHFFFDVITSFFSGYIFGAGTTAHRHPRTVIRVP